MIKNESLHLLKKMNPTSLIRSFLGFGCSVGLLGAATFSPLLRVDQFGYPETATKVAVLADPVEGFNATESYTPGNTLEVRRVADDAVVFSGAPVAWNGGAVHAQSGDRVWWFDFSSVQTPGDYYVFDPSQDLASDDFTISDTVYLEILKQAVRMYFYQRSGFAKDAAYAGADWSDDAAFMGPNQDTECRARSDFLNEDLIRDLHGGWFDAGDFNKYTLWGARVVVDLLLAYDYYPHVFLDDYNIPESGNGIPDLLDEVKWEMDWLLRMQEDSGAVLGKVAVSGHQSASPASATTTRRYYGPVSTEATAACAGAFALGSKLFAEVGMDDYAATLRTAALKAWDWSQANPDFAYDDLDFGSADPTTDDYGRLVIRMGAAVHLFDLTGESRFRDFFDQNYEQSHAIQWWYFYPFEAQHQNNLVHYCTLEGATPSVVATIKGRMASSIDHEDYMQAITAQSDAYRAYLKDNDYTWGSNSIKSRNGTIYLNMNWLGVAPERATTFREVAAGYVHYLHGVNPMGKVMLTNMYDFGAVDSVNEMYHNWFGQGTDWDNVFTSPYGPPPGYLVGGPNKDYTGSLSEIKNQPIQKRYQDFNDGYPKNSWEITEPAIYYQSSYIRLLAAFIEASGYEMWRDQRDWAGTPPAEQSPEADPDGDQWSNFWEYASGEDPLQTGGTRFPELRIENGQTVMQLRNARPELEYRLEVSSDLDTWSEAAQAWRSDSDGEVRWTMPDDATRFLRPAAAEHSTLP